MLFKLKCRKEFIEQNHKKLKVNDKLRSKIERHYSVTKSLFTHYKVEQKLMIPLVEYSRYVLDNGNENERTALAKGVTSKLAIEHGVLRFIDK